MLRLRLFRPLHWNSLLMPAIVLGLNLGLVGLSTAQERAYTPIPLQTGVQIKDRLSDKDIPTGQGGFAKDYVVSLTAGDQIAIDLISEEFDTIVLIINPDGSTLAENDDGPDGSTNSLLFTRITKSGNYIVRVRAFGETNGGAFTLKVTRLRPV